MIGSSPAQPSRAAFIFIFITVALDMLALGIIVPVLPRLIVEFEGGDIAKAAAISGAFGTVWARDAVRVIAGTRRALRLVRKAARRAALELGIGPRLRAHGVRPDAVLALRGEGGFGHHSASFGTAGAYIADVTPPEQRAARFGMLGAAFGFGFVVGPAVGGPLGAISLRLPFWVAGALSLANFAYGLFILPESLPKENRFRFEWRKANPLGSIRLLVLAPELLVLTAAMFLMEVAHQSLPSVFVLYADYRYHWTESDVGLALALVGITSTIVSAALVGPAVAKLGERMALMVGLVFFAAAFAMYGLAPTGSWMLAGIPLGALGGLAAPAMQGLMTQHATSSDQGKLQGALGSLAGIAGLIGPLLFTQTFAAAIRATGGLHIPGAPYLLAAILVVLALAVSTGFFASERARSGRGVDDEHDLRVSQRARCGEAPGRAVRKSRTRRCRRTHGGRGETDLLALSADYVAVSGDRPANLALSTSRSHRRRHRCRRREASRATAEGEDVVVVDSEAPRATETLLGYTPAPNEDSSGERTTFLPSQDSNPSPRT